MKRVIVSLHHSNTHQTNGEHMDIFRGFIAIDVPFNKPLHDLFDAIKNTGAHVKLVETENIHITLKFLGDTQEVNVEKIEEMIKESIGSTKPFTLHLKGTGVFPNEKYVKVLWVGIQHAEPLIPIVKDINSKLSSLNFKKENKPFSAHLTIGRMKSAKGKDDILEILSHYKDTLFSELPVNLIKLKQSVLTPKGPIYSTKKEIMFKTLVSEG